MLKILLALGILCAAGLSDLLGQSAVLFLNRVPPRRFLLCLASGLLLFLSSAVLWAVSLFALGWLLQLPLPPGRCLWLVALAHTPLIFGVTVLLPHFGTYIYHFLRAWVFLNLVIAVELATGAAWPPVIAACLPGWLLHFSLTHLELLRLERFQAWLWRTLT